MRVRHIVVVALMAVALAGCSEPTTPATPSTPAQSSPSGTPATTTCLYPAAGQPAKPDTPPSGDNVKTSGTITFTMKLTAGAVVMDFDRAHAPCAVHSFESLVSQKYFDGTDCHRLVPGFVLQCGDPTGTGRGGPGYSFADELKGTETYPRGTVAMANAGPDTNGSQFFIVLADAKLPPNYDVLGTVSAQSMAAVDAIAAKGVDPADPAGIKPLWGAHIDSITAH